MKIQPEIKNGIKQFLDSIYREGCSFRESEATIDILKQYIISKNGTENISDSMVHDLANILMRKRTPVNYISFNRVINWLTEEELNNIITKIDLTEGESLSDQLRIQCAEYFGIKGKRRSFEFFAWADKFIHDKHGLHVMRELKLNSRPIKLDTPWQFVNLIYDLKIGPKLGTRLSQGELTNLCGRTYLDCSYLEDYDFPEPFYFNLEMFIKAGGTHDHVKKEIGQLLLGLNKREYLGFWHAKLKSLPLRHYGTMRIGSLLRQYLKEELI